MPTLTAVPTPTGPVAADSEKQDFLNQADLGDKTILSSADVTVVKDKGGETALHWLAIRKVVEILTKAEVSTVVDREGETPLHLLADKGVIDVLDHPDVATVKGYGGWTPLNRLTDSVSDPKDVGTLVKFLNKLAKDPENNMEILKKRELI
ncbi:ANK domain containing protein [uncultured Caudovirales phage]|uniref:ANK domain containing protein n=1 Tax=uncultured Caudovirales phage TaxID=2100421 RepID=A0A6J5LKR0_9CAUD|nr:ANK domain containing protein [uncultured Caudovirales phage]CAB4135178.1 ANK domain containing protein [uncultured Caudovirales phage]